MDNYYKMISAASGALEFIFSPTSEDKILILTDTYSEFIAEAFKQASLKIGCDVETYEVDSNDRPLKEIPEELEKMLAGKSIVLNIIKAYSEEIVFRIKWIFKVEENKSIKMGHMPGITEEMMLRSVNVDFLKMKTTADKLINELKDASRLHIKTEEGTDILLGVKERIFSGDIGVSGGEMCNLPCGEIYCAPIETEADGVVVFNASIGDIGMLEHPLKVFVSKGKITKFESDNEDLVKRITELTSIDNDAWVIGELGIGVNPGAQITGNMLEDEKAIGTAHIAFGNNADFPGGGQNNSKIHRDYLFYRPNIKAIFPDGTEKLIMSNGEVVL
ncbi:MAG: aminopeptidase [Ignavibacterium sp.]|jgi:leucyl aminopeptidase (aminopeptidase T)|nr:aminopeptidase [Ignavibacterium sp.]